MVNLCLILFAYRIHPEFKLIAAANRDEDYDRPTAAAHFWPEDPRVLAGQDLKKMGTWMGVTTTGRFAAVTNYRDPLEQTEGKRSRGELVSGFLSWAGLSESYTHRLIGNRLAYPGYNLLMWDGTELHYYSNIEKKLYLFPAWLRAPPTVLQRLLDDLLSLLSNADPSPDKDLPSTGISLEWEKALSPMFIKTGSYGTKSSTALLLSGREILYKERVYDGEKETEELFRIPL